MFFKPSHIAVCGKHVFFCKCAAFCFTTPLVRVCDLVVVLADDGNCDGEEMLGTDIAMESKPVIPFVCENILTCLDGYASPPTYAQCVALGPVTSESIRLDYNAAGPGSKKVKVSVSSLPENYISINEVFLWVRKARQYLNECRSRMAFGQEKPMK